MFGDVGLIIFDNTLRHAIEILRDMLRMKT